ncbi:MAG: hypothetical protein KDK70_17140 [Myxococcales bacterium]|nr:hypothetical protein [Myxococcales bacterium]
MALRVCSRTDLAAHIEHALHAQRVPSHPSLLGVELRPFIERAIGAAVSHGLERGWDVFRFVACAYVLGEDFVADPAHAWPRKVLARLDLSPTQKIEQIERHYLRKRIRSARAGA